MTDYVFGEWVPDQPDLDNPGLTECKNVIPTTGKYKPFPSESVFSSALAEAARGSWSGYSSSGQATSIIGTQTKLYVITSSSTPSDASGAVYSLLSDMWWKFTRYGDEIFATNGADQVQKIDLDAPATFSDMGVSTNPKCRHLATAKNFLVLGNTVDSSGTQNSQRVWWSAIGEPENFPTPGGTEANEKQSGFQDLNDPEGGWIQGLFGGDDLIIFLEHSIWQAIYIGGNFVWQFTQIETRRGLFLDNCAARVGKNIYFLDETGFFVLTPGGVKPIGYGKVDQYFWDNVNDQYLAECHVAVDYNNQCVFWVYVDANSGATVADRALCYNFESGKWSRIHLASPYMFYTVTTGYTLEELDVFGILEDLPASLDSRFFTGGVGILSGVDTSNRITRYNATALDARIESQELEVFHGRRAIVMGVRPVVNGGPTVTVQVGKRNLQSGGVSYGSNHTVNTTTGWYDMREEGRYHRVRVDTSGTFTALIGVDLDVKEGGAR